MSVFCLLGNAIIVLNLWGTSVKDIWTLLSVSRLQKIVGGVFVSGVFSASAYYLERQVCQNSEDIKRLDVKMNRENLGIQHFNILSFDELAVQIVDTSCNTTNMTPPANFCFLLSLSGFQMSLTLVPWQQFSTKLPNSFHSQKHNVPMYLNFY